MLGDEVFLVHLQLDLQLLLLCVFHALLHQQVAQFLALIFGYDAEVVQVEPSRIAGDPGGADNLAIIVVLQYVEGTTVSERPLNHFAIIAAMRSTQAGGLPYSQYAVVSSDL